MKTIKLRALKIYDAVEINKSNENFLIAGEFTSPTDSFQRKWKSISMTFLPEVSVIEVKDEKTKFHVLIPVTNVAKMLLPESEWDAYSYETKTEAEIADKPKRGRPKAS